MYKTRGLGAGATTVIGAGSSIGAPIATVVAAPSVGAALGISASLAAPIIGAAIAGVTLLVTKLIQNSGCGVTCVETSQWANQAEPLLQQNLSAYFNQPAPRSQSSQAAALQNFDAIWARLEQLCGQQGTGNAGVRCISDRQSGACTWKQTKSSSIPGVPPVGQCWNWFSGYRDPIANDPDVVPDAQLQASAPASSGLLSSIFGSSAPSASGDTVAIPLWAWLGAAALVAWWVVS